MPAPPDKRKVELAKIRFSQCGNVSKVAREFNVSARTIGRWVNYDDDPEFAEEIAEIRHLNQTKFITDAWRISHKALEVAEERLDSPKTSAKDAITSSAILVDKIHMMETFGAHKVEEDSKVTFIVKVEDGNTSRPLPEPGEVLQLESQVSSDDRGQGFGEDVLPMLRGD